MGARKYIKTQFTTTSLFTIFTGKPLNQWKKSHQIPLNMKESPTYIGVEKDRSFFYTNFHASMDYLTLPLHLNNYAMSLVSPLKGRRAAKLENRWLTDYQLA